MSTLLRPAGSLPPGVYWRRRLVLVAVLVLVVVLAVVAVGKLGGGDDDATPGAEPGAGASTTPTPSASTGVPLCSKDTLSAALEVNGSEFAAGVEPAFTVTMTNTSDVACLVDVSHETRSVTVTSGPARVWGSGDCVTSTTATTLLIGAGKSEASTLTWDRSRSEEGCPRTGVVAKAGTYRATADVLGASSKEVVFVLK